MSYHAASFNRNQTAIRTMQDIAAGVDATPSSRPAAVASAPIRHAKDLLSIPTAHRPTVHTAAHTANAQANDAPQSDAKPCADTAPSGYDTQQKLAASVSQNDKDLAAVMWLASLIFLMIPGMLVLLNSNTTPYLRQEAREALNWTVTFVIGSIICTVLALVLIGGPLQILLGVAHLVFCLLGANAAHKGINFRAPIAWRPLQG